MAITVKKLEEGIVRVTAEQEVDHAQAFEIFHIGLSELSKSECEKLEIDLRSTQLLEELSLYKMYKLIHILKDGLGERAGKVTTTVFYQGVKERQHFLEKTVNKEGIRLFFAEEPGQEKHGYVYPRTQVSLQ